MHANDPASVKAGACTIVASAGEIPSLRSSTLTQIDDKGGQARAAGSRRPQNESLQHRPTRESRGVVWFVAAMCSCNRGGPGGPALPGNLFRMLRGDHLCGDALPFLPDLVGDRDRHLECRLAQRAANLGLPRLLHALDEMRELDGQRLTLLDRNLVHGHR